MGNYNHFSVSFCLIVYIANIEEEGLVGIWCSILWVISHHLAVLN